MKLPNASQPTHMKTALEEHKMMSSLPTTQAGRTRLDARRAW